MKITPNSELTILGVGDDVDRFSREITPAQEALLDWCSHVDAPALLTSLDWMIKLTEYQLSGGATTQVLAHLDRVATLMESLQEIIDERH